ncbi:MAG: HD domain-containing protein [Deltaproteobacteria bacterium]|jgi:HD-GYP domain-containing protein (c-di-GMP phosphodiesterase class II)|nr:HD domain-containing protein [Deltaproteobacteria bacterium]
MKRQPKNPRLRVMIGENPGAAYDVAGKLRVGRDGTLNDVVLKDASVSREHAVLTLANGEVTIESLGRHPVVVNGDAVAGRRALRHGDVVTMRSTLFVFEDQTGLSDSENELLIASGRATDIFTRFVAGPDEGEEPDGEPDHQSFRLASRRLKSLYELSQTLSVETDLERLLDSVGDSVLKLLPASNVVVLLINPKTGELEPRRVRTREDGGDAVPYSRHLARRSFDFGEAIHWSVDSAKSVSESVAKLEITEALVAPLEFQDLRLGVMYVDTRGAGAAFTPRHDLEFVVAFARSAAIALSNARHLAMLERSFRNTLVALSNAVEARDHYTVGHTWRVTCFAVEIAREMGLDESVIAAVETGGVLHDVGKIAIPDSILSKPGPLTDDEFAVMRGHPQRGARILEDVESLRVAVPCVLYHHEKFDGAGYPFGLRGEKIPLEGRVVCLADAFDAMTSDRPYRKRLALEEAVGRVREGSGTHFDPRCVSAFDSCHRRGLFQAALQADSAADGFAVKCPYCDTLVAAPARLGEEEIVVCHVCHRKLRLRLVDQNIAVDIIGF